MTFSNVSHIFLVSCRLPLNTVILHGWEYAYGNLKLKKKKKNEICTGSDKGKPENVQAYAKCAFYVFRTLFRMKSMQSFRHEAPEDHRNVRERRNAAY